MNSKLVFKLAVCLISISHSLSSPSTLRLRHYCGTALKLKMDEVCYENEEENLIDHEPVHWNKRNGWAAGIYPPFYDANLFIPIRHQRGIIEECCLKGCSAATLKTYCSR